MLTEVGELTQNATVRAHVCIIGAGAAGIAMARRMIGGKLDVVLLESGGETLERDTQRLYRGAVVGIPYRPLDTVRLRFFGGTTNHWAGQSRPLSRWDFTPRPWVPYSGWPIPYEVLAEYLPAALEVARIGSEPFDWPFWKGQPGMPAFPFDPARFAPRVFRYPSPVTRFGTRYHDDLAGAGNVRCMLYANVLRLITDRGGETVTHAEVASLDGRKVRVVADRFVIATGGIENVRLLLNSGNRSRGGLGNAYDQAGRYFMEHPWFTSGEIKLSAAPGIRYLVKPRFALNDRQLRVDFQLNPAQQEKTQILNHSVYLVPIRQNPEGDGTAVGDLATVWNKVLNKVEHLAGFGGAADDPTASTYQMRVRLEHAPDPDSRVTLSDDTDALGVPRPQLDMRIGELEAHTVATVQEAMTAEFGRSGLGRMRPTFSPEDPDWKDGVDWQMHHSGGTRMHDNPRQGVVNTDCRVHGTNNVYVAGSSVFPTVGHVNPTLNLLALALRLADHLTREAGA